MRTMKDKERVILIAKIFLDLNGPSTAKEIAEYIETCPVRIQMWLNSNVVSSLLSKHKDIDGKFPKNRNSGKVFWIKGTIDKKDVII